MMEKKEIIKKSISKQRAKGKASVKKGKKFEKMVADLYILLKAEVVQNIEICQKKVDIFATFRLPGSSIEHRVIVECKNEKKPRNQNQRVMELKGLLEIARKSGEADSAEIITNVTWSDQAKGFAKESGIVLLTYLDKMSQLLDFTNYLSSLVNNFEKGDPNRPTEPPLGAYYIDSEGSITK